MTLLTNETTVDDLPHLGEPDDAKGITELFFASPYAQRTWMLTSILVRPARYSLLDRWNTVVTLHAAFTERLRVIAAKKGNVAPTTEEHDNVFSAQWCCHIWLNAHEKAMKDAGYITGEKVRVPRPQVKETPPFGPHPAPAPNEKAA